MSRQAADALMSVFGMRRLRTCASCRHSIEGTRGRLHCELHDKPADKPCQEFDYEPGTDVQERD